MATRSASKIAGKTVTLSAGRGSKITPKQVHDAFDQIFRLNGCLGCGLLGIDVIVHGGDPDPLLGGVEAFDATVR